LSINHHDRLLHSPHQRHRHQHSPIRSWFSTSYYPHHPQDRLGILSASSPHCLEPLSPHPCPSHIRLYLLLTRSNCICPPPPSSRRSKSTQPQSSPCHWTSPPLSSSSHAPPASSPPCSPQRSPRPTLDSSLRLSPARTSTGYASPPLPAGFRPTDAKLCLSLSHTLPARPYTSPPATTPPKASVDSSAYAPSTPPARMASSPPSSHPSSTPSSPAPSSALAASALTFSTVYSPAHPRTRPSPRCAAPARAPFQTSINLL
jgi:hypothetical protein